MRIDSNQMDFGWFPAEIKVVVGKVWRLLRFTKGGTFNNSISYQAWLGWYSPLNRWAGRES